MKDLAVQSSGKQSDQEGSSYNVDADRDAMYRRGGNSELVLSEGICEANVQSLRPDAGSAISWGT